MYKQTLIAIIKKKTKNISQILDDFNIFSKTSKKAKILCSIYSPARSQSRLHLKTNISTDFWKNHSEIKN